MARDQECIQYSGENNWREETRHKVILKKKVGGCRLDSAGQEWGPEVGLCGNGNEFSGSVREIKFLG
jgi:hypothetical protein